MGPGGYPQGNIQQQGPQQSWSRGLSVLTPSGRAASSWLLDPTRGQKKWVSGRGRGPALGWGIIPAPSLPASAFIRAGPGEGGP